MHTGQAVCSLLGGETTAPCAQLRCEGSFAFALFNALGGWCGAWVGDVGFGRVTMVRWDARWVPRHLWCVSSLMLW
ncbi:uncharacterized protein K452DRAFT_126753 [Aplosporella prunicola CBS 121167]|uniref:Uncharacterized protein n=1 Tax=Aplosporella prunicola CBS 121167 TaxID=1176127 RepID=A0A6A6AXR0_9PEZI|nr:uncharacterized protein K452DRAFT_126753 [Aplosporella prunicola CBS 121167]KAF2136732.1 hypothetical protein K452DRAFT_126753 [Aplosporella prunicola CBS 121167]